jgi:hypothetical protein
MKSAGCLLAAEKSRGYSSVEKRMCSPIEQRTDLNRMKMEELSSRRRSLRESYQEPDWRLKVETRGSTRFRWSLRKIPASQEKKRKSGRDTYLGYSKGDRPTRLENQSGDEHVGGDERRNHVGHEQHEEKRTRGRKAERKTKLWTGETYSVWIKGVWGHRECGKGKGKRKESC